MSYSSTNRSPLFRISVDKLLTNWTALQLAVDNGQGKGMGKEIAIWMRGAVEDYFYENDNLMGVEVSDLLGELMNQELDTIVDDNSLDELGGNLCQHFLLAMANRDADLFKLHQDLDAVAAAGKPQSTAAPVAESDESSCSDEEMDTDDPPSNSTSNTPGTSSDASLHRTGHNIVTEPDQDGWVTVVKSKKH